MPPVLWKVGELARQAGLSVRTLHYYEEIGLLHPKQRTEAGYRLYAADDVARLQRIRLLRQLGFSLDEIRECMGRPQFSLQGVIELHIRRLGEQIELARALRERLKALSAFMASSEADSVEVIVQTMEVMNMVEKYYTPEQLAELKERREQYGEEYMRQVEAEWPALIAQARAEMEKGTDPSDPKVQALAKRWKELIEQFTGGNPQIAQALQKMYEQEDSMRQMAGVDPKLMEYVGKAMKR
jgi:MerR family transcriptional regulator, thiopeptide resistance regulator